MQGNGSKILDRQVWTNDVDPDQTALEGSGCQGVPSASFGLITLW